MLQCYMQQSLWVQKGGYDKGERQGRRRETGMTCSSEGGNRRRLTGPVKRTASKSPGAMSFRGTAVSWNLSSTCEVNVLAKGCISPQPVCLDPWRESVRIPFRARRVKPIHDKNSFRGTCLFILWRRAIRRTLFSLHTLVVTSAACLPVKFSSGSTSPLQYNSILHRDHSMSLKVHTRDNKGCTDVIDSMQ